MTTKTKFSKGKRNKIQLNKEVYHKDLYWGREPMIIVGIRKNEVELEGDYSGGTHNVCQKDWMPIKGLLFSKSTNLKP